MANASETKVTRRDAIVTTGKAAVALGAAALLTGRLPKIQPLDTGDNEDNDMDEEPQPTGGLRTVALTYMGNDDEDTLGVENNEVPPDADESAGFTKNLVDLELVPLQFVISQVDPTTLATPAGNFNTVSVMTVSGLKGDEDRRFFVHVWTDQQGAQGIILPPAPSRPIVVGTKVDVEALEDAVRSSLLRISFTINAKGSTYLVLAFGSHSTGPPQDDEDNDNNG